MLLVADIGNTNVVIGLFEGDKICGRWRLASDTRRTADEYGVFIEMLLSRAQGGSDRIEAAVVGSVVPVLSDVIDSALRQNCHAPVFHVTHATPMPVANKYAKPQEVGVDRLANAVASVQLYGAPIIAVDVGTAVTLDVVSKDQEYLGGAILPGIELSAEALARRTARLPRVAPHEPHHAIGRTTVESIRSGLLHGLAGAVDRLIEEIWKELGYETKTIATGGLASSVTSRSHIVKEQNEDLTLIGLKEIYSANKS